MLTLPIHPPAPMHGDMQTSHRSRRSLTLNLMAIFRAIQSVSNLQLISETPRDENNNRREFSVYEAAEV